MEDKSMKTEKIVVNTEHELTDIVRSVHKSEAERIILTFTEQSDLLISPVNLKVIQETANKGDKLLIAQIIQNPTGVRNSRLANIKVIETPTRPTEEDWEEALMIRENSLKPKVLPEPIKTEDEIKPKTNNFEQRVNSVIERNRSELSQPKEEEIITMDDDIKEEGRKVDNNINPQSEKTAAEATPILGLKNRIGKPKFNIDKKYLTLLPKIVIPLIAILMLGAFAYYTFVPFVKVRIFVEAKPITVEKTFIGDPNIQSIDFDNLKIPIKSEEVTKSLSNSVSATGKAYKGEKATGNIRVTYTKGPSGCSDATPKVVLSNGQKITAEGGLSFLIVGTVELTCNSMGDVQLQAADIGEEYNIPSSKFFSIPGYSTTEVYGLNSAAFSGGTKEEYTVLSQQDVNSAVESLTTTALEELKSELKTKNEGWAIIENTIKSEVDKNSIKTDVAIGAQSTTANVQLSIKGSATYYLTKDLNEKLTDLIRTEAQKQNLFESDNDLELVLGNDLKKDLSVDPTSTESDVKINLSATSNIKPAIDKTTLENKLKGMSWNDGLKYLSELNYAAQPTEVEFKPDNFPAFLRHFPSKQGGVLITIVELQGK